MNELTMQNTISILRCPRFWRDNSISRSKFLKGDVQNEEQWGYLYNMGCDLCKLKNECKETCKHRSPCKLYVIKTEEGIVKVKRTNVNARLPMSHSGGAWFFLSRSFHGSPVGCAAGRIRRCVRSV